MEGLKQLIRNLAIILLLASFLEMLLPNKKMRGYVQLVLGLFVISALIHPITQFLRMPLEMGIPAFNDISQDDLPVLADGQNGVRNPVQEQFRIILSNQIRALILGVEGVEDVSVEITFNSVDHKTMNQPEISRVDILLMQSDVSIQSIKPVIIEEATGGENQGNDNPLVERVRERVVSLMQIPEDTIVIRVAS